jgi:hypothetical protein
VLLSRIVLAVAAAVRTSTSRLPPIGRSYRSRVEKWRRSFAPNARKLDSIRNECGRCRFKATTTPMVQVAQNGLSRTPDLSSGHLLPTNQDRQVSLINSSKEGYTSLVFALETDRDAVVCYCEVWRIYLKKPNN